MCRLPLRRACRTILASMNLKVGKWSSIAREHGMHFSLQRKSTSAMRRTTVSCLLRSVCCQNTITPASHVHARYGDKDTFRVAFKMTKTPYNVVSRHAEVLGSWLASSSGHALFCGDTMLHFSPDAADMPLFAHRTLSDWNATHIETTSASEDSCSAAQQLVSGCYSDGVYGSASFAHCMAEHADGETVQALVNLSSGIVSPTLLGRTLSWTHVTRNTRGDWAVHRPHPLLLPAHAQGEGLCVFVGIDTEVTAAPHTVRSVERAGAAFLAEIACSDVFEEVQQQLSDDVGQQE